MSDSLVLSILPVAIEEIQIDRLKQLKTILQYNFHLFSVFRQQSFWD